MVRFCNFLNFFQLDSGLVFFFFFFFFFFAFRSALLCFLINFSRVDVIQGGLRVLFL